MAPVLAAVGLAGALPAEAAPAQAHPGVTVTIPGLGRATELELIARSGDRFVVADWSHDVAHSTPYAYGVAADSPGTVDLTSQGLATRAWGGLAPKPGGIELLGAWSFRREAQGRMLPVRSARRSADPTAVESNLDAGGSTWTWTYRGVQYLNDHDHGRQMQAGLFVPVGNTVYNPNEAGDEWSNVQLDPDLRHGSPVAAAVTRGTTQSTRAVPLEWQPSTITSSGSERTPVLWEQLRIGKDLTLDWGGMAGVARYRTVIETPEAFRGHLEMPTVYLRAPFNRFYGVDAVAGTSVPLQPTPLDAVGLDWVPPSGVGGVVAATADGRHAMGIYGVTQPAGGPVRTFTVHSFVEPGGSIDPSQHGFATTKLRALRDHADFPAGTSTYDAWIVTGTVAEVVDRMAALSQN